MKIILASQSNARKKALDILGLQYEVKPSYIDEKTIRHESPERLAVILAEAKAKAIGDLDAIIIAGDLFVVFKNEILEKPKDEKEAYRMLSSFSGKTLEVVASVAVYNTATGLMRSAYGVARLKFRKLTDYEIKDYIKRYPVTTFSGAFDGVGALRFAENTSGNEHVAVFPMPKLIQFLRENNVQC